MYKPIYFLYKPILKCFEYRYDVAKHMASLIQDSEQLIREKKKKNIHLHREVFLKRPSLVA